MEKEFVLGNLLSKVTTKRIPLKKGDCPTRPSKEYNLPARTATSVNHGLSCFVPKEEATILKNVISVSANGDFCAFWHDKDFTILQDAYALEGIGYSLNREIALYIISGMYVVLAPRYNWNNKSGWEKIKKEKISLPIKTDENNEPIIDDERKYHDEGFVPDFNYMQERIKELEQERIKKLEQERIKELEQYLVATGLNDYELTEEEIGILNKKVVKADFSLNYAFDIENNWVYGKNKNWKTRFSKRTANSLPVISGITINNGENYYTEDVYLNDDCFENCLTISTRGEYSGSIFYHDGKFLLANNILAMPMNGWSKNCYIYIGACISKLGYGGYNGYPTKKSLKNDSISLPIKTDENNQPIIDEERKFHPDGYIPDLDYMEKYIKAIEKVVIADVVKFKDTMIEKTKEIVA